MRCFYKYGITGSVYSRFFHENRIHQPICHGKADDLVLAAIGVIKKEFMPHVTNDLYISMCAMTAVPKE